ncbi:urea carboxylase-associated family protein [Natrarchaeobius halalkaliphilus]|uniref:Urea carboxylase-associated family protein n=1 Tax=Natrarchaeobius halalkaliphilus TaxID=1679091 RepID=A0A3N6M1A4_9EURY|nr:urea carboxylase-associated family protein [Natrarchaeobius halalkaliphilus]RQG88861.1 urea carboxylase-associated family protein [Natrarchaeobius halalkaliphilus]
MIDERIEEKRGISFAVDEGEQFEVTDPEGEQVADLVAFNRHDVSERFSPKYSYRRTNALRPTTGDTLYTTEGNPILEFVDDDCGVHDLLYAPCNHWVVGDYYGQTGEGGCRENLTDVLEPEGVLERDLQETLNVFMKSVVTDQTTVEIAEPESEPGDTVTFEAKQDVIVGIAACSGESTVNADETKPIDVTVPDGSVLHRNYS